MHEIESGIYYEDSYPGVTLGALTLSRGTILIDAPLRIEDGRAWRAALLNRGSGIDRILINLDSHPDRTIGARSLDCPVVAHEKCAQVFRNRPATFKSQAVEVGAAWETLSDLGSSRWAAPDITFTDRLAFHWGRPEVLVEYHAGPAPGSSWVVIPDAKIAFIGDAVVTEEPPFLAEADLPAWISTLELLLSSPYRSYTLIPGRGGPVAVEEVRKLKSTLQKLQARLSALWDKNAHVEEVYKLLPGLLSAYTPLPARQDIFEQRLRYGLERYYIRRAQPIEEIIIPEEEKPSL